MKSHVVVFLFTSIFPELASEIRLDYKRGNCIMMKNRSVAAENQMNFNAQVFLCLSYILGKGNNYDHQPDKTLSENSISFQGNTDKCK